MLDIKNYSRLAEVETPFYFYDTDLFGRTADSLAALSETYRIRVIRLEDLRNGLGTLERELLVDGS